MISVISCSRTAQDSQRIKAHFSQMLTGELGQRFDFPEWEFIGIVGETNIARGYNVGFARSKGDVIVLCHDDIEVRAGNFSGQLYEVLDLMFMVDVIGSAGASEIVGPGWVQAGPPHLFGKVAHILPTGGYSVCLYGPENRPRRGQCVPPTIKVMDGLFLACRRKVMQKVAWDESFPHHCSDVDWTYRCYLAGFNLAVADTLNIFHASPGNFGDEWHETGRRFMKKHATTIKAQPAAEFGFAHVRTKTMNDAMRVMNG